MHELGIAMHIMDTVEEIAVENQVSHISGITLEIGEVSGILFDYLTSVWKWASDKKELFKDSELRFEIIAAYTYCHRCRKTYSTISYGRICPHCGSPETELMSGNGLSIKEMEVY